MFLWRRIEANLILDGAYRSLWGAHKSHMAIHHTIHCGFCWDKTNETIMFWSDMYDVLKQKQTLTEQKIRDVFVKHGIEI